MKLPFTKSSQQPAVTPARLSWCERVTASPTSPSHIRVVPAGEDLVLGGGLRVPALCGRDLEGGWDTHAIPDAKHILDTIANEHETNRTCRGCSDAALAWLDRDAR